MIQKYFSVKPKNIIVCRYRDGKEVRGGETRVQTGADGGYLVTQVILSCDWSEQGNTEL